MQPTHSGDTRLTLRCPNCQARLRAARDLVGQVCPCPRCRHRVVVQVRLPSDADIHLVPAARES